MCCPSLYMPLIENEGFYFCFVLFFVSFFPAAASSVMKKICHESFSLC